MTELLEKAFKAARELPIEEQDAVAGAVMSFMNQPRDSVLTDEQLAEVHRRLANPNRKFVSFEEVRRRLEASDD